MMASPKTALCFNSDRTGIHVHSSKTNWMAALYLLPNGHFNGTGSVGLRGGKNAFPLAVVVIIGKISPLSEVLVAMLNIVLSLS